MKRALLHFLLLSAPYLYVQATADLGKASPDTKTITVKVHLHNTGDLAASCTVKLGGQTKVTGVSASRDADVLFDGVTNYKGYTVACQAG